MERRYFRVGDDAGALPADSPLPEADNAACANIPVAPAATRNCLRDMDILLSLLLLVICINPYSIICFAALVMAAEAMVESGTVTSIVDSLKHNHSISASRAKDNGCIPNSR